MVRFSFGLIIGLIVGVFLFQQSISLDNKAASKSDATFNVTADTKERIKRLELDYQTKKLTKALTNADYQQALVVIDQASPDQQALLMQIFTETLKRWMQFDLDQARLAAEALAKKDPHAHQTVKLKAEVDMAQGEYERALIGIRSALVNAVSSENRKELERMFARNLTKAVAFYEASNNAQMVTRILNLPDRPTQALLVKKARSLLALGQCNSGFSLIHSLKKSSPSLKKLSDLSEAYAAVLLDLGYEARSLANDEHQESPLIVRIKLKDDVEFKPSLYLRDNARLSLVELSQSQAMDLGLDIESGFGMIKTKLFELAGHLSEGLVMGYVIVPDEKNEEQNEEQEHKEVRSLPSVQVGLDLLDELNMCLDLASGKLYISEDENYQHENTNH